MSEPTLSDIVLGGFPHPHLDTPDAFASVLLKAHSDEAVRCSADVSTGLSFKWNVECFRQDRRQAEYQFLFDLRDTPQQFLVEPSHKGIFHIDTEVDCVPWLYYTRDVWPCVRFTVVFKNNRYESIFAPVVHPFDPSIDFLVLVVEVFSGSFFVVGEPPVVSVEVPVHSFGPDCLT